MLVFFEPIVKIELLTMKKLRWECRNDKLKPLLRVVGKVVKLFKVESSCREIEFAVIDHAIIIL